MPDHNGMLSPDEYAYDRAVDRQHEAELRATYTRSDLEAVAREAISMTLVIEKTGEHSDDVHACPKCVPLAAEVVTRYLEREK